MGMTLVLSGNAGTRSATDTPDGGGYVTSEDGTEPGKESETAISEILLVLADAENRNVAAGLLENAAPVTGTTGNYVIAVPFRYVKELTGQTLNVYVFCNPTEELKSLAKNTPQGTLPTDFVDKIYTLSDFESDAAWQPGHFPMSNARAYTTTLPDSWNGYRAIASPFPLLGLPRIASTLEDFQWILSRYDSTVNGVTFCAGSLSARPDNDLPAMARALAPRIHFVHLRNTQRSGPRDFYESGHLVGSVDMYAVLRVLLEEQRRRRAEGRWDTSMPFRPDHGLRMLDDFGRSANPGYPLVGRMKGFAEICGLEMGIERSLWG